MRLVSSFLLCILAAGCAPDNRTETLLERAAVIETVNRLFIATDNRDWSGVRTCFSDTVLFDMTSVAGGQPVRTTPHNIVDGWEEGLKGLKAIHHQAGNHIVTVRGAEADAFCYGIAIHYLPNPTGRDVRVFVGSYDFHLLKNPEGWRINSFKFNLKFVTGNMNLQAAIGQEP